MAQNYRNQSGRPEAWRGARYQSGSERERQHTGGERFNPYWDDERTRNSRAFDDRSQTQGGYSEEFGYRRSRNRDDNNDRELGSRYYGSRGSSGANYQSGRSYGGDYDREGQSRFDEGRFDEGNRASEASGDWEPGERDLGGPEFTLRRDRGTSTSRWHPDEGDDGGYFNTGSYVDDGGSWRGFGRDFERARARVQQESDAGSFRSHERDRETSGDFDYYGRSPYGSQANYSRGEEEDRPWRGQRHGYEDRSSWNYGGGQHAGSGSASGAYGRDFDSSSQSFRGRGPKGYQRSDDRLKEMICERLTDDPAIDASNITIDVTGQCVKLTGTVDDRSTKYEIEELVENFGGVKDIDNQLRVQSSQSSFGPSSAAGTQTQTGQQARGSEREAGASGSRTESRLGSATTSGGSPSSASTGRKN